LQYIGDCATGSLFLIWGPYPIRTDLLVIAGLDPAICARAIGRCYGCVPVIVRGWPGHARP
jgi:hypothetical protein